MEVYDYYYYYYYDYNIFVCIEFNATLSFEELVQKTCYANICNINNVGVNCAEGKFEDV